MKTSTKYAILIVDHTTIEGGMIMLKPQGDYTTLVTNFEDFVLLVYTVLNDIYQRFAPESVTNRRNYGSTKCLTLKLSPSASVAIWLASLRKMPGILSWRRIYRHLFPDLCSRTRRALLQVMELIRKKLAAMFPIPSSRHCVVDSFPLAVRKLGRARHCRSFRKDGANYGKHPSSKETCYGFRVHALATLKVKYMPWGSHISFTQTDDAS